MIVCASRVELARVRELHRLRNASAGKGIEVFVRLVEWLASRPLLLRDAVLAVQVRISVEVCRGDRLLFLVRLATL